MGKKGLIAGMIILGLILLVAIAYFTGLFSVFLESGDEIRIGDTGSHSYVKLIIEAETQIDEIKLSGDIYQGMYSKITPFDNHYNSESGRSYWKKQGYDVSGWTSATKFCRDVLDNYGAYNCFSREEPAFCSNGKYSNACGDTGYSPCGGKTSVTCIEYEASYSQNFNISIKDRSIYYHEGTISGAFETEDFSDLVNELCNETFYEWATTDVKTSDKAKCELIITATAETTAHGRVTDFPKLKHLKVTAKTGELCIPNWECSEWSECYNEKTHKTCTDIKCGMGTQTFEESCEMPIEEEPEEPIEEEPEEPDEIDLEPIDDSVDYTPPVDYPDDLEGYWNIYKEYILIGAGILISLIILITLGIYISKK